ncbi:MAG: outer membrane beta-barrel protein [Epsilonproteobacteria bacterium]|nr:outer membrane beta-barrel protein [Campylobacterota bacterium]
MRKTVLHVSLIASIFVGLNVQARDYRTQKTEFFMIPMYIDSTTLEFDHNAKVDLDSGFGLGFGFGYNFTKNFEGQIIFSGSSTDYTAIAVDDKNKELKIKEKMYTSSMFLQGNYNILDDEFTPFVGGYIGITYVDSGVTTGDYEHVCYWDPWWGYVCGPMNETYTTTEFSYGMEIGLRYDLRDGYGSLSYVKHFINLGANNGDDFDVVKLLIGMKF